MAMNVGGPSGGPVAEMNITPLIDVLLVLIIIFMVIHAASHWANTRWYRSRGPAAVADDRGETGKGGYGQVGG